MSVAFNCVYTYIALGSQHTYLIHSLYSYIACIILHARRALEHDSALVAYVYNSAVHMEKRIAWHL